MKFIRLLAALAAAFLAASGARGQQISTFPDLPLPTQTTDTIPVIRKVQPYQSTTGWKNYKTPLSSLSVIQNIGLGEDLFSFGCKDDGTDQTACINNAMAATPGCVIVDPSPTGFYVAGTITVPRCLIGSVFNPSNSTLSFAYTSHINCNNQAATPCVVVNQTGNLSAYIANVTFLGTKAGDASVAPVASSYGFQWKGGYNLELRDVQFANFDTCAYFGPTNSPGNGPIATHVYGSFLSRCQKHYMVDDGVPEIYFIGGRWGENGGTDYNSADDFVYATKTVAGGAGTGPNGIVFDSMQVNPGNKTVGCAFRWGGFVGSPGGGYGANKIVNSHIEVLSGSGYTGSASRGMFCIDSTVPNLPGLFVTNSDFNEDGSKSMPFFNIDTAVPWNNEWKFANSYLCSASSTLTMQVFTGGHPATFNGDYICGSIAFIAGDTSAVMSLANNTFGSYSVAGQWLSLSLSGNRGPLTDTATGGIFESNQLQQAWTPALVASGGGTITTSAVAGTWTRLPNGGVWAYFTINVSGVDSATGTLSITGLPSNLGCIGREEPGTLGLYNHFSGLNGTPWAEWVGNQPIINLLEPASDGSGYVNLSASKLTSSTTFSGTAVCNLPD